MDAGLVTMQVRGFSSTLCPCWFSCFKEEALRFGQSGFSYYAGAGLAVHYIPTLVQLLQGGGAAG